MAVVEVEGVIPTLAVECGAISGSSLGGGGGGTSASSSLLEPVACQYRAIIVHQEDTKLATNTTRATNIELVGLMLG